jgi:hypothetical protein
VLIDRANLVLRVMRDVHTNCCPESVNIFNVEPEVHILTNLTLRYESRRAHQFKPSLSMTMDKSFFNPPKLPHELTAKQRDTLQPLSSH